MGSLGYWRDLLQWRQQAAPLALPVPLARAWGERDERIPPAAYARFAALANARSGGWCDQPIPTGADHALQGLQGDGIAQLLRRLSAWSLARGRQRSAVRGRDGCVALKLVRSRLAKSRGLAGALQLGRACDPLRCSVCGARAELLAGAPVKQAARSQLLKFASLTPRKPPLLGTPNVRAPASPGVPLGRRCLLDEAAARRQIVAAWPAPPGRCSAADQMLVGRMTLLYPDRRSIAKTGDNTLGLTKCATHRSLKFHSLRRSSVPVSCSLPR